MANGKSFSTVIILVKPITNAKWICDHYEIRSTPGGITYNQVIRVGV